MKTSFNLFSIVLFVFIFTACQNESGENVIESQQQETKKTEFQMYEVSEMTALMERFYANNKFIKQKIERGEFDFGDLPEDYQTIFTAELTDPTDRDDFLTEYSHHFLEAQAMVYQSDDNHKENFNNMVNSCIECHRKKCSGPIERIEKLYIK